MKGGRIGHIILGIAAATFGAVAQVPALGVPLTGDSTILTTDSTLMTISNDTSASAVRIHEQTPQLGINPSQVLGPETSSKSAFDAPVEYVAQDSVILLGNGTAILHGKGNIKYEKMELTSDYIRAKMDSNLVFARGVYDSISEDWIGKPIFKDGNDSYESNELTYNLKTQKGYIRNVVTEQGEGYIIADKTKKIDKDVMIMSGGKYTTCNQHEHPHFYLRMTKAKVKPGDYIATGPAYLVVGEVPVPLAIPFGFFPFTSTYSSGLIMPTFGDDRTRGLYLQGLGYYFAINDYMDLEVTGDIYTKGTWAVRATTKYLKRYKFNGRLSIDYRNDVIGEKGLPNYSKNSNLSIQWTHAQDSKANPYSTFSASVNFSTSGYNRSNINSYYNPNLNAENTKSSSINYTQRFPDSPWSLSLSAQIQQQTRDSTLSLTLPELSVTMSSIYPFKRKVAVGKERWYEKIKMNYNANGRIAVSHIKEDQLLKSNFLRDWQTGLRHSASMSASWMLFKYLSISPSINLTDRMYFQRIDQSWDLEQEQLTRDTTYGFYNVFDFNISLSMSTKLYGFYTPSRKLFPNSKVDKFRHLFTPSLAISYHPDFGNKVWGYYGSYDQPVYTTDIDPETGKKIIKTDEKGNPMYVTQTYSRFSNGIFGTAGRGQAATLSLDLKNNIEMKIRNDKDTTGNQPFKVISIIDGLDIHGGYNFAADSMNWENFSVNLRIKIPVVNYTINLTGAFDPYMYEINALGQPVRTNKQYWNNGRFPHFLGTGTSFSYTFNNQTFSKWFGKKKDNRDDGNVTTDNDENMNDIIMNQDGSISNGKRNNGHDDKPSDVNAGYVKTEIPWNLSLSYTIRYAGGREFDYKKMYPKMVITQNLNISGSIGLGKGWKASTSVYYDITNRKWSYGNISVSKDLHCWNMSASFVPWGPYKSYTFHIGVNASMLKDLKYDKSSTDSTNKRVNWW